MFEQRAKVLKTEGKFLWVETSPQAACLACNQRKQCTVNTFENVFLSQRIPLQLPNDIAAQPGDWIILGIQESLLLKSVALLYLLPVICMVIFALIGQWLEFKDFGVILSALLGLGMGGLMSRFFLIPRLPKLKPRPLRISNS